MAYTTKVNGYGAGKHSDDGGEEEGGKGMSSLKLLFYFSFNKG